jgi:hypothetical protein
MTTPIAMPTPAKIGVAARITSVMSQPFQKAAARRGHSSCHGPAKGCTRTRPLIAWVASYILLTSNLKDADGLQGI